MRPFCLSLGLLLMLSLPAAAASDDHASTPSAIRAISPGCNLASTNPAVSSEPPAWLLLASAVVLLAAGRLAGRP
jgi:hypothetical protein